MKPRLYLCLLSLACCLAGKTFAQDSDLLKTVIDDKPKKEYVYNAFKSSRVIMSQSMEMLRPGVLDFRILHRFGLVSGGAYEFFGLDGPATVRLGLDYGLTSNLSVGIGRSAFRKELDGFIKYRPVQQSTGPRSSPVSLVLVAGSTLWTTKFPSDAKQHSFSDRLAYYWQVIIGRKFSESVSLQLMPAFLHRNKIDTTADRNDIFAPGIGGRIKLSRRVSLNFDYYYVIHKDLDLSTFRRFYNPLSIGFDIETGGHVFQLHFTNSRGMNERAFLAATEYDWGKGDIFFGFNISRSFQIKKKRS
jgi:hypothetical protein